MVFSNLEDENETHGKEVFFRDFFKRYSMNF
jgi:hypothetical protein